jgi:hypothetical protein
MLERIAAVAAFLYRQQQRADTISFHIGSPQKLDELGNGFW